MISRGYTHILTLLQKAAVDHVILRYPHIIQRELLDIDILCETKHDYNKTIQILKEQGFIRIDKEKYRTFWAKKEGDELLIFDIYTEVSWLGWIVLNKKAIFKRKKTINNIITVCSDEDELLIYLAQAVFKNNGLDEYKLEVVKELLSRNLDKKYIKWQVEKNGWEKPFQMIVRKLKRTRKERLQLPSSFMVKTILQCIMGKPVRMKIISRIIRQLIHKVFPPKKATTVCFLGPDGSGKSTQSENMAKEAERVFIECDVKTKTKYFGWEPFLPTTKLLSKVFAKKDFKIVEKMNQRKQNFSLIQEIMLVYYYIEYLAKYIWEIIPQWKHKKIVLIDRYFYDMYAHYGYATKSLLFPLLLKIYPKPDYTFVLEVPKVILEKRKDELTEEEMTAHIKRYNQLARELNLRKLDTNQPIHDTTNDILENIWRTVARRVA